MGFLGITDGIGIFAFIVGCIVWYRHNQTFFFVLIAPFVASILAAYLHQYPFQDRLTLFLAPFAMMIVAEGIVFMLSYIKKRDRGENLKVARLMGILGIISLATLTIPPIYQASTAIVKPVLKQEVKPVLAYVVEQNQPGDKVYVYAEGNLAFNYYMKLKKYRNLDYTLGTVNFDSEDPKQYLQQELGIELQPLRGHRVWFILRANDEKTAEIIEYLDRIGQKRDSFHQTGASAYLYILK
jgi:hypothetical protein